MRTGFIYANHHNNHQLKKYKELEMRRSMVLVCLLLMSMSGRSVYAQLDSVAITFPNKPIRLVVPFSAGGGTDLVARLIGQKLSDRLGQPVIVENRPGAGGNIGTDLVAKAAPDGYVLLLAYASHASNVGLYPKLPFDPINDFSPIGTIATLPNILVVHPDVPAKSAQELIQLAKSNPGKFNFGSGGVGTPNHLAGEMFKVMTRIDVLHVAYKGIGPSNTAQIAGEIQFSFPGLFTILPQVRAGKVRALAVTSPKRSLVAPEVPTMAEAGIQDFEAVSWYGLLAPAKTPASIINRLNAELVSIVSSPDVRDSLLRQGNEPEAGSPQQFTQRIAADIAHWTKIIRTVGIKAEM